jgi:hypothetical protein
MCIQPAGSASEPKLSASSWWSRGNAQWVVQQMRVGWRAGFQRLITETCRLGGVVVSVLATRLKGCGFKTGPRRWIFKGDKNPQHTFLPDGKSQVVRLYGVQKNS